MAWTLIQGRNTIGISLRTRGSRCMEVDFGLTFCRSYASHFQAPPNIVTLPNLLFPRHLLLDSLSSMASKGDPPHPSSFDDLDFQALLSLLSNKPRSKKSDNHFVEKFEDIPKIVLPPTSFQSMTHSLSEKGLINYFTRIWHSPTSME
jgi:hypothetical protein